MKKNEFDCLVVGDRVKIQRPNMLAGHYATILEKTLTRARINVDSRGERDVSYRALQSLPEYVTCESDLDSLDLTFSDASGVPDSDGYSWDCEKERNDFVQTRLPLLVEFLKIFENSLMVDCIHSSMMINDTTVCIAFKKKVEVLPFEEPQDDILFEYVFTYIDELDWKLRPIRSYLKEVLDARKN
jgi:hypothetical protein